MKKRLAAAAVLVALNLLAAPPSQADRRKPCSSPDGWRIPENVRIVQQDNTDGAMVFPTVSAALASIPETARPCGGTRYLVKVMPGVYEESVVLPPCVDLEGAGQDNTLIRSTVEENDPFSSPGRAALLITGDSTVSGLAVVNREISSGYAVVFLGSGSARNLTARVQTGLVGPGTIAGIFAWGEGTEVFLDHVVVASHSAGEDRDVHGVGSRAAVLSLKDSRVSAGGGNWAVAVYQAGLEGGALEVRDSVLVASDAPSSSALEARNGLAAVSVAGTRLDTSGCSICIAALGEAADAMEVLRSELIGDVQGARIAGSKISGRIFEDASVTGCWDAALLPIPDRRP